MATYVTFDFSIGTIIFIIIFIYYYSYYSIIWLFLSFFIYYIFYFKFIYSKRIRIVTRAKWTSNYISLQVSVSEKAPEALAQREAGNFTLSHKRMGSIRLFLKMLSNQIIHGIAKRAQFHKVLLSFPPLEPTLSMWMKEATEFEAGHASLLIPNNTPHIKLAITNVRTSEH